MLENGEMCVQLGSLLWASLSTQGEGIHLQGRQVCQPLGSKFFSFRVDLFSISENGSTLKEKNLLSLGVIFFSYKSRPLFSF